MLQGSPASREGTWAGAGTAALGRGRSCNVSSVTAAALAGKSALVLCSRGGLPTSSVSVTAVRHQGQTFSEDQCSSLLSQYMRG